MHEPRARLAACPRVRAGTRAPRPSDRAARGVRSAPWCPTCPTQIPELIRSEMRLAQAEVAEKGKRAGVGIGMFSVAGLLGFFGLGVLITTFVLLLDLVLPAWAAALIVAVVLFAVAGIAALVGKNKVAEVGSPTPERAMSGIKQDVATVKGERAHDQPDARGDPGRDRAAARAARRHARRPVGQARREVPGPGEGRRGQGPGRRPTTVDRGPSCCVVGAAVVVVAVALVWWRRR